MLDRLESALERERTFVADASHELRTPLALLKTELELALRRPRTTEELERALRSAAEETDRLALLADDLLVLAGHDEDAFPLQRAPVAVGTLLERVAGRFASRATLAGRVLEVGPADAGLAVEGDALRLEQALGNLVANAFVHGAGAIRLSAEAAGTGIVLHVRDEGPGLPPEFLPRAFERFGRASSGRTGAGAGLGLAIVRVLAEAHGGSAELENLPGGGVDARILLPRARP
jgi:signal transduction histidine kinase